jgi:hypothetical protein
MEVLVPQGIQKRQNIILLLCQIQVSSIKQVSTYIKSANYNSAMYVCLSSGDYKYIRISNSHKSNIARQNNPPFLKVKLGQFGLSLYLLNLHRIA